MLRVSATDRRAMAGINYPFQLEEPLSFPVAEFIRIQDFQQKPKFGDSGYIHLLTRLLRTIPYTSCLFNDIRIPNLKHRI